jgi:hypothetical protein
MAMGQLLAAAEVSETVALYQTFVVAAGSGGGCPASRGAAY